MVISCTTLTEETTKESTREVLWKLLYADDLVLSVGSKEEGQQKFLAWNLALENRSMKVNFGKKKLTVPGKVTLSD